MNDRWVKLQCGLRNYFCPDNSLKDFECRIIYNELLIDAAWIDGPLLKRGQVLVKWKTLAEKLPWFDVETIRRRVNILVQFGYVKIDRVSKWKNNGNIFTLPKYDTQPDLLIVQQIDKLRKKQSKNRQSNDNQTTIKLTDNLTDNLTIKDDFNELNLLDLTDIKNKFDNQIDRQFDNQIDNQKKENRQYINYKELRTKKIKNTSAIGTVQFDAFMAFWNSTVKGRIAKIKKLNPTRIKKIKSFLVDQTLEDFQKITDCIIKSPWHNGSDSDWVADFDWALGDKALNLVEKSEIKIDKKREGMHVL